MKESHQKKISFREFSDWWIKCFYDNEDVKEHFLTLPQVSDVFPFALSLHLKNEYGESGITIVELGAGGGELTHKILKFSDKISLNIKKAVLIERSERRKAEIERNFEDIGANLKIEIKDDLSEFEISDIYFSGSEKVVVISNEFFDSLPFSVVKCDGDELKELFLIGKFPDNFYFEFLRAEKKTLSFFSKYMKDEIEKCVKIAGIPFLFEICLDFEKLFDMKWADSIIISDYGYPRIKDRLPYGSVILHGNFRAEKLDFLSEGFEEKILMSFGKKDISFFVDFEVIKKISEMMKFSFSIKHLSSFVFENLDKFKEKTEEILFLGDSKNRNIISFADIMKNWGNFFVAELKNEMKMR